MYLLGFELDASRIQAAMPLSSLVGCISIELLEPFNLLGPPSSVVREPATCCSV
jgi:hypothetical protein